MVHFTAEDFLADIALTPPTIKEHRDSKLSVKVYGPGELRLPVAPPTPRFGSEDENSESFPRFFDLYPPVTTEPLHCITHCSDYVCRHMTKYQKDLPPCRCTEEELADDYEVPEEVHPEPKIELDADIVALIQSHDADADAEVVITIQRGDISPLLDQIRTLMTEAANLDERFVGLLRSPSYAGVRKPVKRAVRDTVNEFFCLAFAYFERTLRINEKRTLTVATLREELNVMFWTGMLEWIQDNCSPTAQDNIFDYLEDPREILDFATSGLPGVVAERWDISLDYVVGGLIWRDQEVRKYEASQAAIRLNEESRVVIQPGVGVGSLGIHTAEAKLHISKASAHMIAASIHSMAAGHGIMQMGLMYMKVVWLKTLKYLWA